MTNPKRWLLAVLACTLGGSLCLAGNDETQLDETVITSDTLLFDYRRSTCVFEGNVVVTEPRVKLECQKLYVFFDARNDVERIVATEAVRVSQSNRVATCGHAEYTAASGTIVMTENAVLSRGKDQLRGDEIKIFINSEKVLSTPGRLIVYPAEPGTQRDESRSRLIR